MPYSYDYFKQDFLLHLKENFASDIKILDGGAGSGSYYELLKQDFNNIDGIEIFDNYIEEFSLEEKYNTIYQMDILDFDYSKYDYIILGDIIEHFNVFEAKRLLKDITDLEIYCAVAVPYKMKQGEVNGNIYEMHLQDDLTHELFIERYPYMREFKRNSQYGFYLNYL